MINIVLRIQNSGIARQGFGLPMILTHKNVFTGRIAYFASYAEVIDAGFDADSPEALATAAIFAQTPHPPLIAIGRAASAVTQRYEIDTGTPLDEHTYTIDVVGEGFDAETVEYESSADATQAEIHAGLVDALNAVVDKNYLAEFKALVNADDTFVAFEPRVYPDATFTAAATDVVTLVDHGLGTGDGPFRLTTSAADLPLNLLTGTDYWVIVIDEDTFYLATSLADARADVRVDIGDAGTGTHTLVDTASTSTFVAGAMTAAAHGLLTGDGPFQLTTSAADLPSGLTTGTDYWAIRLGADTLQLAESLEDALAGDFIDLVDAGSGTHTISDTDDTARPSDPFTVTAGASGDWFSLTLATDDVVNESVSIAQTHAATDLADELAAIALIDNSWYWLVTLYNSKAYVLAAAAWVEANGKAYIPATSDTASITTTFVTTVSPDVGAEIADLGGKRTAWHYHHIPAQMFGAALTGRLAPLLPGSWSGKFKPLTGITASPLTTTHRQNIIARSGNGYAFEDGRDMTFDGKVANDDFGFLDITVGLDAFTDDLRKGQVGVQVSRDKIAIEDDDIALLEAAALASVALYSSKERPVLRRDPPAVVFFPKAAAIPESDRALRKITGATVTGQLSGAVHDVDPFIVTLSF